MEGKVKKGTGGRRIVTNHKQFTKVFWRLNKSEQRFLINKGGAASSKSVSAAQNEIVHSFNKAQNILVIRKVANTLKDSVIPSFRARLREFRVSDRMLENKSERTMINLETGAKIIFRGLDDAEKLKSIEGIDRILVEEATELSLEDFYELNRRVRGRKNIQITLNFNPIDERHWIKKHFFEQELDDCRIIESSYHDNPYLTKADKKQLEQLKQFDYNQYRIYALGEWGVMQTNNPWLFSFDRERHIAKTGLKADVSKPVHLSFDFNINPLTCIAVQHSEYYGTGSYIKVLREFEWKNMTVKEACKMIKAAFPHSVLTATGDASGKNRNAGYETGSDTMWLQVQKGLGLAKSQILVPRSNPSHKNSRQLCNYLLQEHKGFVIDASCKGLINDCLTARPVETDKQEKEDQLLKGAGDGPMGNNLLDCLSIICRRIMGSL